MKLGRMKDGRFFKNIGYLDSGSQQKFYLGRDQAEATVRAKRIERVWQWGVESYRFAEVENPTWWGFSFDLARAIAEGRPVNKVPTGWVSRIAELGVATTCQEALATGLIQTFLSLGA
jgi:hypothetical protein